MKKSERSLFKIVCSWHSLAALPALGITLIAGIGMLFLPLAPAVLLGCLTGVYILALIFFSCRLEGVQNGYKSMILKLADTLPDALECWCPVDLFTKEWGMTGFMLITYDAVYFFVTDNEKLLCNIPALRPEMLCRIRVGKEDGYRFHGLDPVSGELYRSEKDRMLVRSASMKKICYCLDRDGWTITGHKQADYLTESVKVL